jgi:hypothetical protein
MFCMWGWTVSDVPPMERHGPMAFGAPNVARFLIERFSHRHSLPIANLFAASNIPALDFAFVNVLVHGDLRDPTYYVSG